MTKMKKHVPLERLMLTFPAALAEHKDRVEICFYKDGQPEPTGIVSYPISILKPTDHIPRGWYLDAMDQVAKLQARVKELEQNAKPPKNWVRCGRCHGEGYHP